MNATRRRMLFGGVGLIAVSSLGLALRPGPDPERQGEAEAERDVAAGVLRLKTYGLPAPWFTEYSTLMRDRLGVSLQGVAGCVVDERLRLHVEGYNRRMEKEIGQKFGADAHAAIVKEAQQKVGFAGA